MNSELHVLTTPEAAGAALADWVAAKLRVAVAADQDFHLALAGGSTPLPFFEALSQIPDLPWQRLWLYWSDERCVTPDDPESNYGLARKHLLSRIHVPKAQIERLRGEVDPDAEATRYSKLLYDRLPTHAGMPVLDLVLLGLGDDGHTASLFPGDDEGLLSDKPVVAAIHPVSGQLRLSMTPALINRAKSVAFFVTGSKKAGILERVRQSGRNYPAQSIRPVSGQLHWFLDEAAFTGSPA